MSLELSKFSNINLEGGDVCIVYAMMICDGKS